MAMIDDGLSRQTARKSWEVEGYFYRRSAICREVLSLNFGR